ncbi:mycothiol transferase [Geodermatophilus sp. SYSU D00698]
MASRDGRRVVDHPGRAARTPGSGWADGEVAGLRRLLVDLIEEDARRVGHADLIRESVDDLVGEDPPAARRPAAG